MEVGTLCYGVHVECRVLGGVELRMFAALVKFAQIVKCVPVGNGWMWVELGYACIYMHNVIYDAWWQHYACTKEMKILFEL